MMMLSQEQCQTSEQMKDNNFVDDIAKKLKTRYPVITEADETFKPRLRAALNYANIIPITEINARGDFLMLEAFYPDFYQKTDVQKWLKTPNGYFPDQRLEDLKHVMINRQRRSL